MARRQALTDNQVEKLKPKASRYAVPDPELRGHYLRIAPSGVKSYVAVARSPYGKQVWATIETADRIKIDDARERAREAIKRIKAGLDPFEAPPPKAESFKAVAESWLERHVKAKGLRSADEIERTLEKDLYPTWGEREFASIRRGDVTKVLDAVEDRASGRMADHVLAVVRSIMNWHASRNENYNSPIVRGMARHRPAEHARERILSDDEIRLIWPVLGASGDFGAFAKTLLLTAQRRDKVASMRWAEISDEGVWTIPTTKREKGNGGVLKLPPLAIEIVRAQRRIVGCPFVFPGRAPRKKTTANDTEKKTRGHIFGYSPSKRRVDAKIREALRKRAEEAGADPKKVKPINPWLLHDLRRTARSLLARAGVDSDTAEAVLGHKKPGVEGTYNRHKYEAEKAAALEKLATLVERILSGPQANVVDFRRA